MAPRPLRGLLLCCALVALLAAPAEAVLCSSYREEGRCNRTVTSNGACGWDAAAQACVVVAPLPEGMVAITAVEGPGEAPLGVAGPAPAPAGERIGSSPARTLLQSRPPCLDRPTPEGYTCSQQKGWGKCSEVWMVQGGFCRLTCGLCNAPLPSPAPAPEIAPAMVAAMAGQPAAEVQGPGSDAFCSLAPETGPCRGAMTNWFYDGTKQACQPFIYGGCRGNANRFDTFEECDAAARMWCAAA